MRYLILSAVLALTGFASAADLKPVCICGDSCKCAKGGCPGKCPLASKGNADDAYAAVAKGEKIVLCIGVPAVEGAYATGPKKGYTNGVYDCYRENGVHLMQIRSAASASPVCVNGKCYSPYSAPPAVYSVNPFQLSNCPNGNCAGTTTRRR